MNNLEFLQSLLGRVLVAGGALYICLRLLLALYLTLRRRRGDGDLPDMPLGSLAGNIRLMLFTYSARAKLLSDVVLWLIFMLMRATLLPTMVVALVMLLLSLYNAGLLSRS